MKRRNKVALSPLLKKGGAHKKTKSSHRFRDKLDLKKSLFEWKEDKNRQFDGFLFLNTLFCS